MNSRKYVIGFLLLVGIFFWGNVLLWHGYTKERFFTPEQHGDLTRMAFLSHGSPTVHNCNPNKKHIEYQDYINMVNKPSVDIITLGDSFSNGGGGVYYQDYIEELYNKTVLNLPMMEDANPFTTLERLIATGIIDEIHPQVVILESVERSAATRFGANQHKLGNLSREAFMKYYAHQKKNNQSEGEGLFPGIMTKANKNLVKFKWKYHSTDNRLGDEVYKADLCENLFTDKGREKQLLYYYDDMWYQKDDVDYSQINKNLNEMAEKLQVKGISLVVMINVDKMDLYYPYIVKPADIPENNFMEEFSKQPKKYIYIDTKAILRKELSNGETDIYWQDDTHWSWKGQQKVVDVMMEKIM